MSMGMRQLLGNTTTLRFGMGTHQSSPTAMTSQQPVAAKARRNHNPIPQLHNGMEKNGTQKSHHAKTT
jgi:hypothetical protein